MSSLIRHGAARDAHQPWGGVWNVDMDETINTIRLMLNMITMVGMN